MSEVKNFCLGFAFDTSKHTVVLIRKRRPTWQAGFFNGVGGRIEEGEHPTEAMVREFEEETSVSTYLDDWNLAVRLKGNDYCVYVYAAFLEDLSGVKTVTDETVVSFDLGEMWERRGELISNTAWLISLCLDPDFNKFTPVTIEYV